MSGEASIQAAIRVALGGLAHVRLFRNNSGVAVHANGSRVVYGIGNPGGSDLIGWTTVEITPGMLGKRVAVFTAAEVKSALTALTAEQRNFLAIVKAAGGFADVVRSVDDARRLVRG